MNTKILMALIMIGIVSVVAGAGTLAYFSDTETSTGNTFTAGTFDIETSGNSLPLRVAYIAPGWSGHVTEEVHNVGTISGEVWVTAENFVDPGTNAPPGNAEPPEPESSPGDVTPEGFAKVLYMKIYASDDPYYTSNEVVYDDILYNLTGGTPHTSISADGWLYYKFVPYLPTDLDDPYTPVDDNDNLYQADGVERNITFHGSTEITLGG